MKPGGMCKSKLCRSCCKIDADKIYRNMEGIGTGKLSPQRNPWSIGNCTYRETVSVERLCQSKSF